MSKDASPHAAVRPVPVKLTAWQYEVLHTLGCPLSQWIREAVEQRLRREVSGYASDEAAPQVPG